MVNINRYIVECKEYHRPAYRSDGSNINRYIVECKVYFVACNHHAADILIDT